VKKAVKDAFEDKFEEIEVSKSLVVF